MTDPSTITPRRWKLICLLASLVMLAWPAVSQARSVNYQKPFFGYLGIDGAGARRMSRRQLAYFERTMRSKIEKAPYLFVKLPISGQRRRAFVRKMVEIVAQRSKGIAKMRTEWNSQFQGYPVTGATLRSIRNRSFYYWIEVQEAYSRREDGLFSYHFKMVVHIHRLVMFYCTPSKRSLSPEHKNACRNKGADAFVGFSKPFQQAEIAGNPGERASTERTRRRAFESSVKNFRVLLAVGLRKVKILQIHAPVSRATLMNVSVPLGKVEKLQLNQGFDIYVQTTRGTLLYKGFGRVRSIGDNRMVMRNGERVRLNRQAPYYSQIQPLIGGAQKGMLVYERAQSGFLLQVMGGMTPIAHSSFANASSGLLGPSLPLVEGTVLIPTIRAGGSLDISNATGISEFFFDLMLELGVGGSNPNGNLVLPFMVQLGVMKRFYINRFNFSLGARVGGGYLTNEPNSAFLLGGDAYFGLGLLLTPEWSLSLRAGFRAMIGIGSTAVAVGPWAVIGVSYYY